MGLVDASPRVLFNCSWERFSREVTHAEAAVPRINPMAGEDFPTAPVNGGRYQVRTSILGVGLRYQL